MAEPPVRTAVVALQGGVLRYAEAAGAEPLRRLGTVEFRGDAERALLGDGLPNLMPELERAVREVFAVGEGEAPDVLVVAAHPSHTVAFSTPLPVALAPAQQVEQLRQEAALLADLGADRTARVRAVPVRTQTLQRTPETEPEPFRWYHVLHIGEAVHARLTLLARALGVARYDLVDTTRAASGIALRLDAQEAGGADPDRVLVVVGAYAQHTEYAVCRGGAWVQGHVGEGAAPEDTAYYGLALLERLGLDASHASRLLVYGDDARPERTDLLAQMLGLAPEPLDPFALFGRRPDGADAATLAGFAPLLGVALP